MKVSHKHFLSSLSQAIRWSPEHTCHYDRQGAAHVMEGETAWWPRAMPSVSGSNGSRPQEFAFLTAISLVIPESYAFESHRPRKAEKGSHCSIEYAVLASFVSA